MLVAVLLYYQYNALFVKFSEFHMIQKERMLIRISILAHAMSKFGK